METLSLLIAIFELCEEHIPAIAIRRHLGKRGPCTDNVDFTLAHEAIFVSLGVVIATIVVQSFNTIFMRTCNEEIAEIFMISEQMCLSFLMEKCFVVFVE